MLGVVLGSALQLQQPQLWPMAVYACAAVLLGCCLLWWAVRRAPWHAVWLVLLAAVWAASVTGWRATVFQAQALPDAWQGRDVRVQGWISDLPQSGQRSVRLRFALMQAWVAETGERVPLPPHISLHWYGQLPEQGLHAGQRWEWTVRLKAPHGARNPHSMDWELWQWSQGIQATGYVRMGHDVAPAQWLGDSRRAWLAQWRGQLLQAMHPPADASARTQASWGVVQALVTGAQSQMSAADWQLFRDTGIAHLVSISGLHITMFAWLTVALVQRGWRRSVRLCLWCPAPTAAAWGGLLLATAYALFSGWGIPAQRTIGMLAIVVMLRTQGRAWPWPYVWLLVLTAVVLADPWSLLQAGFWLSFVAVGVLFAAQPQHHAQQLTQAMQVRRRWWHRAGVQLLKEQLVLGLALAPLTLLLFGQISVVGMLANLWAIPWVTLVVTPLSMLGVLWPALWEAAAACVSAMVWVLQHMAQWPLAVLYFAQPPWWAALAGVLGCIWWVLPLPWAWRVLALPAVLPMLWWQPAAPAWGQFDLLALDVGQGSAVLLRTQRHSLLFDAGPRWSAQADAGAHMVVPVLRALGVRLTAQMISHADSDHAGGAASVHQALAPAQWLGAGGQPCVQGQHWQWDGVHFEVLWPPPVQPSRTPAGRPERNARSCVLRVGSQTGQHALLTGDIEVAQEQALLRGGRPVQADVMLMPHHGSNTSSSSAWIAAVQPRIAIAQAGFRNRFGHPAPSVLARYEAAGVHWVATPACGAALWQSWQPAAVQCERVVRRRYWMWAAPEPPPSARVP